MGLANEVLIRFDILQKECERGLIEVKTQGTMSLINRLIHIKIVIQRQRNVSTGLMLQNPSGDDL
jgi:hypothetical protein